MKNQNRDNTRELRRALNNARRASDGAWARMADDLRANARPHFMAKATAPCDAAVSVAVEVITPIEGQVEIGDTLTAANVYASPTQYARVPRNQKLLVVRGDHPRWQPNTDYAGGDFVTHDDGGGLKRWERDGSGTSGATFDSDDWIELEDATGWRIGFLFEHIAVGTATSGHDALDGKSFDATIDDAGTPIALTDVANPLLQDVATDDKVLIFFWGQDLADVANAPFLVFSQSSLGGGTVDTDELVKVSADDTSPNYLEGKLQDSLAYNPTNHQLVYRTTTSPGGAEQIRLFTAKATAPAASNDRLVRGTTSAAVKHSAANYTMNSPVGLADGDSPVGSITVHAPIASYESGATVWAIRDQTNTRWIDATPARFTIVKAQTTGAVAYGADAWTVDNVQLLAGGRLPGTVQGNAALRSYRNNEWVWLIWNDENERWEDFTPKQYRLVSYQTTGTVASGASSFTVDNVVALANGANPTTGGSDTLTVYNAVNSYADNQKGYAIWVESALQWHDFTAPIPLGVIDSVSIIADVPARSGLAAGTAASTGKIYAMCNAANVGQSGVIINGREYDFTSATLGQMIEPETPVTVRLFSHSQSIVNAPSSGYLFCTAKKIGEGGSQEEYEIISPLELRTLDGYDGTEHQSIGNDDGSIGWTDPHIVNLRAFDSGGDDLEYQDFTGVWSTWHTAGECEE